MERFAGLLERLSFTPSRNGKLRHLETYFAGTPDPDRGLALAALTGGLDLPAVKPAMLRALVMEREDPELFALSYDYVGDLAETIALLWRAQGASEPPRDLSLGAVIERLGLLSRSEAPAVLASYLDVLDAPSRLALIKLATGGLRVGVSARLAKQSLAGWGGVAVEEIEEIWHGLAAPYADLFAWLEGRSGRPKPAALALFRPVMLANPLDDGDLKRLSPPDYAAEWKWDGIRVQAVSEGGRRRLYSRTGDDISRAFPDVLDALEFDGAIDGELLVMRPDAPPGSPDRVGTFNDLQKRLNRKTVSAALLASHPAFLRAYDLLAAEGHDLRQHPYEDRRARLGEVLRRLDPGRIDLSENVPFSDWNSLAEHRSAPPHPAIEGVMLKRRDSAYVPGRPKGPWFKWKKDPHLIDAVLMYAQRGHGKRSSYYSDYTFGVWTADGALVPVGKAYFGFTDAELQQIDQFVRENTIERYGPVRAVRADPDHGLVLEVAFEGLQRSTRHKSGLAMRFPRIHRLRWDKPPGEADKLGTLEALLAGASNPGN